MRVLPGLTGLSFVAAVVGAAGPALAQDRSQDNAVTQAEDAFGFSVGRESLGIYNSGNTRGFSPAAAGNLRIDGLYFSQATDLVSPLVDSTSIKVGLTAQGYPFAAPSGIVDISLRKPSDQAAASVVVNGDSFSSIGVEVDGSLPISSTLALAYGGVLSRIAFPDGTDNWSHSQSLLARWRPAKGVEIIPFWSLYNDYHDEAGVFMIPAGNFLPPLPKPRRYEGAPWADFRFTSTNQGVLGRFDLATNTLLRIGAFRSVQDNKDSFTNLLVDEQPDGTGERIIIADPRAINRSLSGEARLTQSIADGPRLHLVHASVRWRDTHRQFGGEQVIDAGPGRIGEKVDLARPDFDFGELTRDQVRQTTLGVAYDGRWKDVGEISFGLSRADFRKRTLVPDETPIASKSRPWLYNGTVAVEVAKSVIAYAGYSRGLEESGLAPFNAANRNEPLPVILTEQKDGGVRIDLGGGLKAVAGVFELTRPYFGFNSANVFTKVGTTLSRGAEFSLTGPITPRLSLVAGGYFLKPKVARDADVQGEIGSKPVGLSEHYVSASFNWRQPWLKGLELDLRASHRGRIPATTDNEVFVDPRAQVDLGSHYHFKLAKRNATLRLQVVNLFNTLGYSVVAPGVYGQVSSRFVTGFLAVDF